MNENDTDPGPRTLAAFHEVPYYTVTPRHVVLAVRRSGRIPSAIAARGCEVTTVLLSGAVGDYTAYVGAGPVEWVADHGNKIPFELAQILFPGIEETRYRP